MTSYYVLCLVVFAAAYVINMTYISVFYHRAFTHDSIRINPRIRPFIIKSSNWVTGIDLKAWACMHRMHHTYSDTMKDPHSPKRWGIFGTALGQLLSYNQTLRGLLKNKPDYVAVVKDLDFPVSELNRKGLWLAPYLTHALIWLVCGLIFNAWLLGAAYFFGMMSHPVQGWLVNSFGHAVGYRNFDCDDDSRNNTLVAWTCFGEGYQNNHHRFPRSAKFSMKWFEFDLGFLVTRILAAVGAVEILNVAKLGQKTDESLIDAEASAATLT
jgi:stearoyl-CoA desaturase (delta-9 desaturase)